MLTGQFVKKESVLVNVLQWFHYCTSCKLLSLAYRREVSRDKCEPRRRLLQRKSCPKRLGGEGGLTRKILNCMASNENAFFYSSLPLSCKFVLTVPSLKCFNDAHSFNQIIMVFRKS